MSRTRAALPVVLTIGALLLTGCNEDNPREAPKDASRADFCTTYAALLEAPGTATTKDLRTLQDDLLHAGTPEGIPAGAREAFEQVTDSSVQFKDGDAFRDLATLPTGNGRNAAQLERYYEDTCPD
ncbi:hypothetical protein ncot_02095 [Nocardioides sp. JQ2195]|uniref:hypothetical protein n=1 Tax=Nocardioides sp. JQ2195 TaxID=2592334 RepID=UPI00143E8168|nr:hypothetical protein [Nocardioides sp. JQ2195]QIX25513.1 hypothetical protein ncot_02095 [Nocardioides sp. JQ2195]